MKLTILAMLVVMSFSSPVWAICPQQETTAVFINGVWTPLSDAIQHMKALERAARKAGISPDCVHFELSHTQDDGKTIDVVEAIVQKSLELDVPFSSLALMLLRYIPPYSYFLLVAEALYRETEEIVEVQLEKHLARVREVALDKGHRAVVVTHSQGGLYGNALWQRLTAAERANTRLVSVVTPASSVADGGPNTRLARDGVANRFFLAASVAGMIANTGLCDREESEESDSWLCHGFETGYLHDIGARARIIANILGLLPKPAPSTLAISCGNPPRGTVGVPYNHVLPVTGGVAPYTFSMIGGKLPLGLSLDEETGAVTGVPHWVATFAFSVRVADSGASTIVLHERDGLITVPNFSAIHLELVNPLRGMLIPGVLTYVQMKAWYDPTPRCSACTCPHPPTPDTMFGLRLFDGHVYPSTDSGTVDCQTEDKTLAEWGVPAAPFPYAPGEWITFGPFTGTQCVLSSGYYETRASLGVRGSACASGAVNVYAAGDTTNDQHVRVYGGSLAPSEHVASVECSIAIFP